MAWKVLIPSNIHEICHDNYLASAIMVQLLLRTANKPTTAYINGTAIHLERGQCICGSIELSRKLGFKKNESLRVYRTLRTLEKPLDLLKLRKSQSCSVVTINNYDVYTSFERTDERTVKERRKNGENKQSWYLAKHNKDTTKKEKEPVIEGDKLVGPPRPGDSDVGLI